MRHLLPIFLSVVFTTGCAGDETLRSYGAAGKTWTLVELNGAAFTSPTRLSFGALNRMSGTGPCNSFSATMSVPYPWFNVTSLATTRAICPDLVAETAFFNGLSQASQTEVLGTTMILSNQTGLSMVFNATD